MPRDPRVDRQQAASRRVRTPARTTRPQGVKDLVIKPDPRPERTGATASLAEPPTPTMRRTPRFSAPTPGTQRTRRALILLGTLALLGLVYAPSLRVYFNQQKELASVRAHVDAEQASVSDLQLQLQRWNDPAYVRSQAQNQLGWVPKGYAGYRVIGTDGTVVSSVGTATGIAQSVPPAPQQWWDRLASTVASADAVPTASPSASPTQAAVPTESATPRPTPTPTRTKAKP